jgi:toxin ParE1/3/4
MSSPKPNIELAARAQRDLRGIRIYTVKRWGEQQADAYFAELSSAFDTLRDNPSIGMARDDLKPGVRSLVVREHRVLYRVSGRIIRVLRVVHIRRDLGNGPL